MRICLAALDFSPPQVAKVPKITGWDHLHHAAYVYVGVACDNNSEVAGLAFTDNALWMSNEPPAEVALG